MIGNFTFLRGALLISLCLALLTASGCRRSEANRTNPFPDSNEVVGWVRSGDVRTFPASDLWKYIDGDAERYLKAGVQSVSTTDYKYRDRFDAVVDVYTMGTSAGVQEIFESEPAGDARLIKLGDGVRLYSQNLVLCKGHSLVRITAYEGSADTQPALLALGRGIEQRLGRLSQ